MKVLRVILTAVLLACISLAAEGQDRKLVTGRILDKVTGKPIDLTQIEVAIYSFNTVAEAEDTKARMDTDENAVIMAESITYPDEHGYYEVMVAPSGALIFKADMQPAILEKVNYRLEINVNIELGNRIHNSLISVTSDVVGVLDPQSDIDGNYLKVRSSISLPAYTGKTNSRLIIQPLLIDGATKDTLRYLRPIVMDGKEYRLTQLRWMNYDMANDTLTDYRIDTPELNSRRLEIPWSDTIWLDHPERDYEIKGIVHLEDYTHVYFSKDYYLASSRFRRPMRFLECPVEPYMLDPDQYREKPRRIRRNTEGSMSLNFLVNKAVIDSRDTASVRQLDNLKQNLLDIVNDPDAVLKEFHIVGTASPDGNYKKNLDLATRRMHYAQQQIMSVLPQYVRDRCYTTSKAQVATWDDVADLMYKDSLWAQAEEIHSLVLSNKNNPDRQGRLIRNLPYYHSTVTPYLSKLRTVHYIHVQEVFKELTPEEIMDRYENDPDYMSGKKQFALYEYWYLFNMVKDPDALEKLYKMALDESIKENGKPWVFAANNLAASYIKKGVTDTSLLSSFIDLRIKRTDVRQRVGSDEIVINPEAVVANQMIMYVRSYNFAQASRLCQLLNDNEHNSKLIAFTLALGGYYKGGSTPEERARARQVFSDIEQSSPLNKVIVNLAMNTKANDAIAEKTMSELPADSALTDYLWAVIYGRKGARTKDFMDDLSSEDHLVECFKKDKSFMDIAAVDGDIVEDIYKNAKARMEE